MGFLPPTSRFLPFSLSPPSPLVLFSKRNRATRSSGPADATPQAKLRPAKDALQRILWDPNLDPSDFIVGFVDRFSESFSEVRCDAPNTSIKGPSRLFVLALPEHRIAYIKYRRRSAFTYPRVLVAVSNWTLTATANAGRIVWHRAEKIDRLFASGVAGPDGARQRIDEVMGTYGAWLAEERRQAALARQLAALEKEKEEEERVESGAEEQKEGAGEAVDAGGPETVA